ncbi:MAG: triose-phosphate isomerase [Myxococcota bacterium]
MTRRRLVVGNWKLHKSVAESVAFVDSLRGTLAERLPCDVAIAPTFLALDAVHKALAGSSVQLAAQHCYHESAGAYTGEVSALLLRDVGCVYCIVGHSERRQLFGETDEHVAQKTRALLHHGLVPILCVGETLMQRDSGQAEQVVLDQLGVAMDGLCMEDAARVVVAYEPVWAIGTGYTAAPGDAQAMHRRIRLALDELFGSASEGQRIIYGGSVKPENAAELLALPDVDGALVGGASLNVESFVAIASAAN